MAPSTIVQLTGLTSLALSANSLNGPIPSTIGQLTELSTLFAATQPPSRMDARVAVAGTPSTLPPPDFVCPRPCPLTCSNLNVNSLNGPIPSTIGKLNKLTSFDLGFNQLSGPIPSTIGQLTRLPYLQLTGNSLNGPIPSELGRRRAYANPARRKFFKWPDPVDDRPAHEAHVHQPQCDLFKWPDYVDDSPAHEAHVHRPPWELVKWPDLVDDRPAHCAWIRVRESPLRIASGPQPWRRARVAVAGMPSASHPPDSVPPPLPHHLQQPRSKLADFEHTVGVGPAHGSPVSLPPTR
ncbi:hypothetical protein T492DRAFT_1011041, partial [Pavlovales sp. CCMP2436]